MPDPRRGPSPYRLAVDPPPLSLHWQLDAWANIIGRLILPSPVAVLALDVAVDLDMTARNPFDFLLAPSAERFPFQYDAVDGVALAPFRLAGTAGPRMAALAAATAATGETVACLLRLAVAVRDRVGYIVRMEAGTWSVEHTLSMGQGSCRDSAWVLVQLLRMHGVASRFVSGYLVQFPDDAGRDVAELHAWAEAYLPGAGWIGFDATSGLLTAEGHVALAASPDVAGAAPLEGTVEAAEVRLETTITLSRA